MKKLIIAGLSLGLLADYTSIDNKNDTKDLPTQSEKSEIINKKQVSILFPKDTTPVGEGNIILDTPAGNSENGNVPFRLSIF